MPTGIYTRTEECNKAHKKQLFCDIENCNEEHYSNGLCCKHYNELYRKENENYYTEYKEKWRKKYKEHCAEYFRQWCQTPIGKASKKTHRHNRRALTRDLTKETVQQVYEDNIKKFGTLTCCLCNKPIEFGKDSLEHLTPLTRGGNNNYDNLGIAHLSCNSRKRAMTMEEWLTWTY